VAQKRKRLLVSALRTERGFGDDQTLDVPRSSGRARAPTALDVLEGEGVWTGECPADMRVDLPMLRARERLRKESDVTGLVSPYEASPTVVTTSLVQHTYFRLLGIPTDVDPGALKYSDARALRREHVLTLQSFPADFKLFGASRFQSTCIGNAVPPLFALDIGRGITALLDACTGSGLLHTTAPETAANCARLLKVEAMARLHP
jgi:site-specific DNA-cytosine methylase